MSKRAENFILQLGADPKQFILEESPFGTSIIVCLPQVGMRECLIEDEHLSKEVIDWLKEHGVEIRKLKDPRHGSENKGSA